MKLVGVNPSEKPSALVNSLINFLTENSHETTNNKSLSDRQELARGIFRKMPSYLAQESDLKNLQAIVVNAEAVIAEFRAKKEKISIRSFDITGQSESTGFLVTLSDRPFIIDTIREYFGEKNIPLLCLTHPILNLQGDGNISLSFFQIEKSPVNDVKTIISDLHSHLLALFIATSDFPAMTEQLNSAIAEVSKSEDALKEEIVLFLKWMRDDGFIFLGYNQNDGDVKSGLGILKQIDTELTKSLSTSIQQNIDFINSDSRSLFCSKTAIKSYIHRHDYLDIISVKSTSAKVYNFVGLFTSKTRNQEVSAVPILRKKLADVLIEEGLIPNSHDYKELISLADTLPKSDFLQYSKEQVRSYFQEVTDAHIQGTLKLIHIVDRLEHFHYFTVALPRDRYSLGAVRTIESILRSAFTPIAEDAETHAVLGDHPLVLVRTMVPFHKNFTLNRTIEELEELILEKTIGWDEKFRIHLSEAYEEIEASNLYTFYSGAFSKAYQSSHNAIQALSDLKMLESLNAAFPLEIAFNKKVSHDNSNLYQLKIYKRGAELILSNIVPYLENSGFDVISEIVSPVASEGAVWANIYDLYISPKSPVKISEELSTNVLLPALKKILIGEASNDILNYLLINPGLDLNQIRILRGYVRYLSQIKATSSPRHAMEALVTNPDIAALISEYFDTKFNPRGSKESIPSHERISSLTNISQRIQKTLKKVTNITHDRVLATLIQVIDATVRTNSYIREDVPNISFKIDPSRLKNIPNPKPFREIFVSSPEFQGVHLRGGKIARGGLRWSSRPDDFRTEVLGLMKTQMVKNSIIVPVGAKGGFILHEEPTERKELLAKVESTYKKFIRALLDITDNRIGSDIKSPANCICYDEHDPYFVVAADRGTATFSDIANNIATKEYGFWLEDAFASGGSAGYDHKQLGITAKGAWECAKRHFIELGIDIKTQEFTVTGIGDMSGDVFGNGLLLSDNAKLIAAFDHRHVFIDPNPDSKVSFKERERLFNLAGSSWGDYDKNLLSTGGAVLSRSEKEVNLSEEAKIALGTETSICSINELIQIILKAPVDLLWNGGIGTYIKSSEEDHLKAADRTNDEVRVDAKDIRVRIIAEGGNLGLTQLGRIEYARIGGRINTDAVDNSAGVGTSDIEVNLKLLFRESLAQKSIKLEERDQALRSCEAEICDKIVERNYAQSLILSLAAKRSRGELNFYKELVNFYEKLGRFNRNLENLPSEEVFEKRKLAKAGLSRPELAVLIAHTKMWVFEELLNSNLPDIEMLQSFLYSYFPKNISKTYSHLLPAHPLKREIIATQVANYYVERMGATFTLTLMNQTGSNSTEIFKAYLLADMILDTGSLAPLLKNLDNTATSKIYISALLRIQATLETMTRWFIEDNSLKFGFEETINSYKSEFLNLISSTDKILSTAEKNHYESSVRDLLVHGVPKSIAKTLSASRYAPVYLDIIRASKKTKRDPLEIAKLYSSLAAELHIGQLIDFASSSNSDDHWENLALNTLGISLRTGVATLCDSIVTEQNSTDELALENYFSKRQDLLSQYQATLQSVKQGSLSVSTLFIMSQLLENLGK